MRPGTGVTNRVNLEGVRGHSAPPWQAAAQGGRAGDVLDDLGGHGGTLLWRASWLPAHAWLTAGAVTEQSANH
jgi:hypothetical protein